MKPVKKKTARVKQPKEKSLDTSNLKKLKLVITIVNRNKVEFFADLLSQHSVNLQLFCAASGTASTDMLRYLGLGNSDKGVLFSVVREDKVKIIMETLEEKFATVRNGKGIAFVVPFSGIIGVLSYGFLSDTPQVIKEDK